MEEINPEMTNSYRLAEEISHSYQDRNYLERKNLRKSLVTDDSTGNLLATLPEHLRPKFESLNEEAKRKAKADLNAKYIKQGMYGGQSHIQAASGRMRELNDATLGTKSNLLKNELPVLQTSIWRT